MSTEAWPYHYHREAKSEVGLPGLRTISVALDKWLDPSVLFPRLPNENSNVSASTCKDCGRWYIYFSIILAWNTWLYYSPSVWVQFKTSLLFCRSLHPVAPPIQDSLFPTPSCLTCLEPVWNNESQHNSAAPINHLPVPASVCHFWTPPGREMLFLISSTSFNKYLRKGQLYISLKGV